MTKSSDVWTERLASGWIFWPATAAGVFFLALAIYGPEVQCNLDVKQKLALQEGERDVLQQTHDNYLQVKKALEEDPQYLERAVRHELGIVRPGEMRLPQKVKAPGPVSAAASASSSDLPTWQEVVALFGNSYLRFVAMTIGGTLLAIGLVLSLPGRKPKPQPQEVRS